MGGPGPLRWFWLLPPSLPDQLTKQNISLVKACKGLIWVTLHPILLWCAVKAPQFADSLCCVYSFHLLLSTGKKWSVEQPKKVKLFVNFTQGNKNAWPSVQNQNINFSSTECMKLIFELS